MTSYPPHWTDSCDMCGRGTRFGGPEPDWYLARRTVMYCIGTAVHTIEADSYPVCWRCYEDHFGPDDEEE